MIDRRSALIGLGAALTAGSAQHAAARSRREAGRLMGEALAAAGGAERLGAVRSVAWQGRARVHAGDREIDIVVDSRIEPFGAARSDSWLATETSAAKRSLILDAGGSGWIERGGVRTPMSPAMTRHERQQYGIYALLLLAPVVARRARIEERGRAMRISGIDGMPPTTLHLDPEHRVVGASNSVDSPEGGAAVAQRFGFSQHRVSMGVLWPMAMRIEQAGRPYFDLWLDNVAFEQ